MNRAFQHLHFLAKKIRLSLFLLSRVPGHGFSQLLRGLKDRVAGYRAMEFAAILPARADVIIDAGAHHGIVSSALDLLYEPKLLLSVEASPTHRELLRKRFKSRPHITVVSKALSDQEGTVSFNAYDFDASSSLFQCHPGHLSQFGFSESHSVITVQATTLALLLDEHNVSEVDLLKIDCQGAELAILKGAGDRISDIKAIYAEISFEAIYDRAPLFSDVHAYLLSKNFYLHRFSDFAGKGRSIQWCDALYLNKRFHPE